MKETAFYHKQEISEFQGNPLLEALPPLGGFENYPKLLTVLPDYSEDERKKDVAWRLNRLQILSQIHIPTKDDNYLEIKTTIHELLRFPETLVVQGFRDLSFFSQNPTNDNSIFRVLSFSLM